MSTIKDDSSRKKQAFKSFLQTSTSSKVESKKNLSDHEEVYEEQFVQQCTGCTVCGEQVADAQAKRKVCGFCEQAACAQHLRKRRRKKNKYEKICDNCEDKYLYDCYMKLQIKAEESLAVAEQITTLKLDDLRQILESKQAKRRDLSFQNSDIKTKCKQKMDKLLKQEAALQSNNHKIEAVEIQCHQMQEYIQRMQNKIKSNYQQDFKILSIEDTKMGEDLTRAQKRCAEIRGVIDKREKQLEEAYENWEKNEFQKAEKAEQIQKRMQKDKCVVF